MKGNKIVYPEFESLKSFITPSMLGINLQCNYSLEVHFEHKGMTLGSKIAPAIFPILLGRPVGNILAVP